MSSKTSFRRFFLAHDTPRPIYGPTGKKEFSVKEKPKYVAVENI